MDRKAQIKEWTTKELPSGSLDELMEAYEAFHTLVENTPDYTLAVDGRPAAAKPDMITFIRQLHAAMGMCGEAAEIHEKYKKRLFGKHQPINNAELVLELGDLFWYFALMVRSLPGNITFAEIITANIRKLAERYGE